MPRPLVPDVAFLAYTDLGADAPSDRVEVPLGAPTVAVEISPDDRRADIDDKIPTYLAAGTRVVLYVDPQRHSVTSYDARATCVLTIGNDDVIEHDALPSFRLSLVELFADLR